MLRHVRSHRTGGAMDIREQLSPVATAVLCGALNDVMGNVKDIREQSSSWGDGPLCYIMYKAMGRAGPRTSESNARLRAWSTVLCRGRGHRTGGDTDIREQFHPLAELAEDSDFDQRVRWRIYAQNEEAIASLKCNMFSFAVTSSGSTDGADRAAGPFAKGHAARQAGLPVQGEGEEVAHRRDWHVPAA